MVTLRKDQAVVKGSRCAATFNRDADGLMHGTVHGEFLTVCESLGGFAGIVGEQTIANMSTEHEAMVYAVEHACWGRH
ncbi:hypothetical protein [Rhodococcus zopfii]|uniref:hypothetical protein n=1 Tax=Rhodococcus zopfii TaxID=43772 RepID=UPI00111115AB|nr:hypothetical protein [Rhodococcus zopfii]